MASCLQFKCLLLVTLSCILDYFSSGARASTSWEHLSLRYGTWYRPPRSPREAQAMGYRRVNGICQTDTYHGFLYVHPHNDKSRLIFDLNDRLSGIQTAIPGNMRGFNALNQSVRVPNKEVVPPILLSKEQYSPGVQMYTITAYFKHPKLICSPLQRQAHPGKGLYIQMGYRVDRQYEKIPLDARRLSKDWKTGTCLPVMGRHYFKWLSPDLPCERLYPVFLMYNGEGQLGGFGWLFQGTPPSESKSSSVKWLKLSPQFYPAIFDPAMLPSCMSNPEFRVFGVRIYLRNEVTMTCPQSTEGDKYEENYPGENANENDISNVNTYNNNNNNNNNDNNNDSNTDKSRIKSHHIHRPIGTVKPVVKIPPKHKGKNTRPNNWDPTSFQGPVFTVKGTNHSSYGRRHHSGSSSINNNNGVNSHTGAKKNNDGGNRGSYKNSNKNNVIVDDVTRGGYSCCLKPLGLLSLLATTYLSFITFSILSSSSPPLFFTSSLSSFSSLLSSFANAYLPFSPSCLSYKFVCTKFATVPFFSSSPSPLKSSSLSLFPTSSSSSSSPPPSSSSSLPLSYLKKPAGHKWGVLHR